MSKQPLYPHTTIQSTNKASLTKLFKDEKACGIWYDKDDIAHLPTEGEMGNCGNCAHYVVDRLGRGEVYGFFTEGGLIEKQMPDYHYEPIIGAGGHDFAVIDNRYIVDLWISLYTGDEKQIVFDLEDPKDSSKIKLIYGDRQYWINMKSR